MKELTIIELLLCKLSIEEQNHINGWITPAPAVATIDKMLVAAFKRHMCMLFNSNIEIRSVYPSDDVSKLLSWTMMIIDNVPDYRCKLLQQLGRQVPTKLLQSTLKGLPQVAKLPIRAMISRVELDCDRLTEETVMAIERVVAPVIIANAISKYGSVDINFNIVR